MYQVSILGLGLIGSRIARHMTGLGDKVTVWNRTVSYTHLTLPTNSLV